MTAAAGASASKYRWMAIAAFIVIFIAALFLDIPVSTWVHERQLGPTITSMPNLRRVLRFWGQGWAPVIVCGALLVNAWLRGYRRWPKLGMDAAIVALAAIFSAGNAVLKICIGRVRPFHGIPPFELHPFEGGFHASMQNAERSFSFPSGDVSLAFAMTASMCMVVPRLWPLWWALGIEVMVERVCENAHYPSDTVGGAALGIGLAYLARWIIVRLNQRHNHNRIEDTLQGAPT